MRLNSGRICEQAYYQIHYILFNNNNNINKISNIIIFNCILKM